MIWFALLSLVIWKKLSIQLKTPLPLSFDKTTDLTIFCIFWLRVNCGCLQHPYATHLKPCGSSLLGENEECYLSHGKWTWKYSTYHPYTCKQPTIICLLKSSVGVFHPISRVGSVQWTNCPKFLVSHAKNTYSVFFSLLVFSLSHFQFARSHTENPEFPSAQHIEIESK